MKIPLYSLFTPSHRALRERYFEPTLPDDVDLHLEFLDQPSEGVFHDESWRRAVIFKVELILEALRRHAGGVFAYTDVDVQFFGSFASWFHRALSRSDLIFQTDAPGPALCTGFILCRSNEITRAFWRQVLDQMRNNEARDDDQAVAGRLVWTMPGLKFSYLPPIFYGGGTLTGRPWLPGERLEIPGGLLMHHANFTIGVSQKILQLEHVRDQVRHREFIPLAEACRRVGIKLDSEGVPV